MLFSIVIIAYGVLMLTKFSIFSVRRKLMCLSNFLIMCSHFSLCDFHPIPGFYCNHYSNYFLIYITTTEFQTCLFNGFFDILSLNIPMTSQT